MTRRNRRAFLKTGAAAALGAAMLDAAGEIVRPAFVGGAAVRRDLRL